MSINENKNMGFFDQIAKAETYNNLPYIEPGEFTFRVENVLHITSKQGKGDFLIAELYVEEAVTASPVCQAGSRVSLRCKLSDNTGPKNAASFLLAALGSVRGKSVTTLAPADEAVLVGPNSQAVGKLVKASAFLKPKKTKPGEQYTHINWFPVTGQQ